MKCDHCQNNEATVHMTNIVNNQKEEQHLCSECASQLQKEGKLSPFSSFMNDMWDNPFFTNDFFQNMVYPHDVLQSQQQIRCPGCGNSYDEFNRVGKFGCPQCYDTFQDQITSLVERLQGSTVYNGHKPKEGTNTFKMQYEIKELRQQLEKAIQKEAYEEAATLRDKIKQIESSIEQ